MQARNAFCAVRPPGHHAGPTGVAEFEQQPHGSHGFCLLNNLAIGAAYAVNQYRKQDVLLGIQDVAAGSSICAFHSEIMHLAPTCTLLLIFHCARMSTDLPDLFQWSMGDILTLMQA